MLGIPYNPRHTIGRVRDLHIRERGMLSAKGHRSFPDAIAYKRDVWQPHVEARVAALTLLASQGVPLFPEDAA